MSTNVNFTAQELEALLDEEQTLQILNVPPGTLTDWIQENKITYLRLGWRTVRFRRADIEAFIARSLVPANETPAPSRIAVKRTKKREAVPA